MTKRFLLSSRPSAAAHARLWVAQRGSSTLQSADHVETFPLTPRMRALIAVRCGGCLSQHLVASTSVPGRPHATIVNWGSSRAGRGVRWTFSESTKT